ncbi:transcription factor HHO3-like [Senna tora]|uniref:Transcription factor HHO3-like n=1 Tax=Senna tora TaxID=362788 RepID=A0A834WMZ7_9FABA|nr:transcription factor HHO3-like [Senna tora]
MRLHQSVRTRAAKNSGLLQRASAFVGAPIEACKQQLSGTTTEYNFHGQSECSEQTTSMEEGPVLEEFIPIKKRASPESSNDVVEDDEEQSSHKPKILKENHSNNNNNKNFDKRKSDWLKSVQLWKSEEKDGQVLQLSILLIVAPFRVICSNETESGCIS